MEFTVLHLRESTHIEEAVTLMNNLSLCCNVVCSGHIKTAFINCYMQNKNNIVVNYSKLILCKLYQEPNNCYILKLTTALSEQEYGDLVRSTATPIMAALRIVFNMSRVPDKKYMASRIHLASRSSVLEEIRTFNSIMCFNAVHS